MRVLLVNPPPHAVVEPVYDRPDYPRTSLACLAGYLRANGIEVGVLDCKYDRLDFDEGLRRLDAFEPHVVGLCGLTNEIRSSARFAERVKERDARVVTVIGDVHVTALPERTLREMRAFDFGVIGEGEASLLALVRALSAGTDPLVPGVARIDEAGVYRFGGARESVDVASLPMPAWDLFRPALHYIPQTSRGCPFACQFCMNPAGRTVRARTPAQVVEELELLVDRGRVRSIYFGDEIFTVKRARIVELCTRLIASGLSQRLVWSCQTHVNTIDAELARLMRAAGCESVGLGVETADEAAMKTLGKGIDRGRVQAAVDGLRAAGMPFNAFFILGQPNETEATARETIDFAVAMNPRGPVFGIMVPYPGTTIGRMAARSEGGYRGLSDDWNDYNKQIGHAVQFDGVSRRRLERLQMLGYLRVYLENGRLLELLAMVPRFTTLAVAMMLKQIGLSRRRALPPPKSPPEPSRRRALPVVRG